jgi:hypothetical protein
VTNGFSFLVKVSGKYGSMKVLDPSGKVKEGFGGEWCSIVVFETGGREALRIFLLLEGVQMNILAFDDGLHSDRDPSGSAFE